MHSGTTNKGPQRSTQLLVSQTCPGTHVLIFSLVGLGRISFYCHKSCFCMSIRAVPYDQNPISWYRSFHIQIKTHTPTEHVFFTFDQLIFHTKWPHGQAFFLETLYKIFNEGCNKIQNMYVCIKNYNYSCKKHYRPIRWMQSKISKPKIK